ncbi:hypothetical protein FB468_1456 [Leucobacter komagatae]|uniref:LPXTG-motif cell wall-anchored protein n=1 Tax=Leucobacter komagatae TaxID=55969 RepID=A0A542Y5W9_9MICO|nr:hypothetical protein [Leucobacter komagatae]TQL43435.1 hypothetical protein FB468_1456 [Leucobacter komagatae]
MTARRLLATLIAGGFAVTAAAVSVSAPSPALATQPAGGESTGALTVTPARQLFNVTLHPGEEALATAQVHNGSGADLELALTPVVVGEDGPGDGADALLLSSLRTTDCTVARMAEAGAITLAAAMPLPQGTITAGSTIDLCVRVSYPEAVADEGTAVSVVDLAFTGIERGTPVRPVTPVGPDLAGTGATGAPQVALLLGAAGLITAGAASLLRHPRRSPTAKES